MQLSMDSSWIYWIYQQSLLWHLRAVLQWGCKAWCMSIWDAYPSFIWECAINFLADIGTKKSRASSGSPGSSWSCLNISQQFCCCSVLCRWQSTGCPERQWSLLLGDYMGLDSLHWMSLLEQRSDGLRGPCQPQTVCGSVQWQNLAKARRFPSFTEESPAPTLSDLSVVLWILALYLRIGHSNPNQRHNTAFCLGWKPPQYEFQLKAYLISYFSMEQRGKALLHLSFSLYICALHNRN